MKQPDVLCMLLCCRGIVGQERHYYLESCWFKTEVRSVIWQPGFVSKDLAKHYAELFEKRHKGDYNDFFDFDEETVLRLIEPTREFINRIDELLKG